MTIAVIAEKKYMTGVPKIFKHDEQNVSEKFSSSCDVSKFSKVVNWHITVLIYMEIMEYFFRRLTRPCVRNTSNIDKVSNDGQILVEKNPLFHRFWI